MPSSRGRRLRNTARNIWRAATPPQAYEAGIKQRIVIVEFESVAKAVEAHDSPDYQAALKVLDNGVERDLRIVEGLE